MLNPIKLSIKNIVTITLWFVVLPFFSQELSLDENVVIEKIDSIYANTERKIVFTPLLKLVDEYRLSGDYISTIIAINKINNFYDKEKNKRTFAGLNSYLGQAYNGLGLYSETINKVSKSLMYARKEKDTQILITSLMILSEAYMELDIKDKGKRLMIDAYGISDTINDIESKKIVTGNLSLIYSDIKKNDSVKYYLDKLELLEKDKEKPSTFVHLHKGNYYLEINKLDSAIYYSKLFQKELKYFTNTHTEMALDRLFSEIFLKKKDFIQSETYANKALAIAIKEQYKDDLVDIYELLSDIYKNTDTFKSKLYFDKKETLKDSVTTSNMRSAIENIKLLYEIDKKSSDIEKLNLENTLKESKLKVVYVFLFGVISIMVLIFFQKKKINKAYKKLVEENVDSVNTHEEITNLRKKLFENSNEEIVPNNKIKLTQENANAIELMIRKLFDIEKVFLEKDLDLDKLANYLNSNRVYVSYVFNNNIKLSFSEMLNKYRINEAKKLLLLNVKKYTIEAVALESGFKNKVTFNRNFKRLTGVTPSFFVKNTREIN